MATIKRTEKKVVAQVESGDEVIYVTVPEWLTIGESRKVRRALKAAERDVAASLGYAIKVPKWTVAD